MQLLYLYVLVQINSYAVIVFICSCSSELGLGGVETVFGILMVQ